MMREFSVLIAKLAGWFDLAIAIGHVLLPWLFMWRRSGDAARARDESLMRDLNWQVALVSAGFAFLMIRNAERGLVSGAWGDVLLVMALFWAARAGLQAYYFGLTHWFSRVMVAVFLTGAGLHLFPVIATW
jgi:hypothetical protein